MAAGGGQHHPRDLEYLERRIEELAHELQKAQAEQLCPNCQRHMDEVTGHCAREESTTRSYPMNRQSPPKDQISFFVCKSGGLILH